MKNNYTSEIPAPKFIVGQQLTYKDINSLPNNGYFFSGASLGGSTGIVASIGYYLSVCKCYDILVSTKNGGYYKMIESEFLEYDKCKELNPFIIMLLKRREYKLKYGKTKWQQQH